MLGNIAKRTYNGYAKSESITENIKQMTKALKQLEEDKENKKNFKAKKWVSLGKNILMFLKI